MIKMADLPAVRAQLERDAAVAAAAAGSTEAPPTTSAMCAREQIMAPIEPMTGRLYVSTGRSRVHSA
jgi:hypothetical protein